ncbi:stalk domain-containing protein [Cohnella sp. AR92]|uniref:RCC1 domain-containing protein n=1 Tax=Cohnella sp. AR92 TaxID=648716 RepID=UPI000F8EFA99|nr:stalk domain-containing protein [Cohnella sp. AR92]RUS47179.1 hypothetical protein ELR57_12395 [Cohnella sp. AR92]
MSTWTQKTLRLRVTIVLCCLALFLPVAANAETTGSNTSVKAENPNALWTSQIEAGDSAAYAVGADGTVWGWGGGYGALGHGATTPAFLPVRIRIDNVKQVSSGYRHTLFLKKDGTVWAVGGNEHGQLGIGKQSEGAELVEEPVQVPGLTDVIQVSAGDTHSLAVKSDGTVWAWGGNENGELGDDSRKNGLQPRLVNGLPKVNSVAAGRYTSLALGNGGEVWVWGLHAYDTKDIFHGYIRKPTQLPSDREFTAIAADLWQGAALDSTGAVWVWENYNHSSWKKADLLPVQVPKISQVVSLTTWSAVDANGQAWSWEFYDGSVSHISVLDLPVKQAKAITAGRGTIYVLMSDGSVYSKGDNNFGQLGQGILDPEAKEFKPVLQAASIRLNGETLELAVPPLILNGTTYVPLRGVLEKMGVDIRWDTSTRWVIADKGDTRIVFNAKNGQTTVDGKAVQLDVKPINAGNSLLVPLRFVSETLGAKVSWNAAAYSVEIAAP